MSESQSLMPSIDVTEEARKSLLDHLSRAGAAQYVRVQIGFG